MNNDNRNMSDPASPRTGCPVDRLGWFANGTLSMDDAEGVEAHLAGCAACRADVEAWSELRHAMRGVSAQTPEPRADLLAQVESSVFLKRQDARTPTFQRVFLITALRFLAGRRSFVDEHLRAQARLIRRELFWMPLLLLPLVGWTIYVLGAGQQASGGAPEAVPETAALVAALLAALGMAFLYGQEVDPAHEMALATPTSPRLVLGMRCCLVFGYNLLLNCGVVLPLLAWLNVITPGWFLTNWLAPLCCLSAIALLLSIAVNPAISVMVCVLLCALRVLDSMQILRELPWQRIYDSFWSQGPVLFMVAILAVVLAFGLLERKERFA